MAHSSRVCILPHSIAENHRATDQKPPCDSHLHCSRARAQEQVLEGRAKWTNGNHSAIEVDDCDRGWFPVNSGGYTVLQYVPGVR